MIDAHENSYRYDLRADPFRLSPDHRFAFSHPSYAKARTYLEFAIRRGEGFVTITGGVGTGKTTLINEIVAYIRDHRILIATLNSTQLESRDLLHMVAAAFGLRYDDVSKATLLQGLEEFLAEQQRKNKRVVLIVDEAQGLSPSAMEELRLLANLQRQSRLLLQVALVGQPRLRDMIQAPGMEHLRQRVIVAAHLYPLTLSETVTYVEHRLKKVHWEGEPAITENALRLIHKFSGGVPRRINLICSRLFLFGGLEGKRELTGADAQAIIEDLQQESLLPNEAPESTAGERAQQQGAASELPLSLPRDVQTAPREHGSSHAQQTHTTADAEPEEGSFQPDEWDDEDEPRSGSSPAIEEHRTLRAAPGVHSTAARMPGLNEKKPYKHSIGIALLAVATGLALGFALTMLNRSGTLLNGAAMIAAPADAPVAQPESSAEHGVTSAADESARNLIQEDDGSDPAQADVPMEIAQEELSASEREPQQQPGGTGATESQQAVLSVAKTGDAAAKDVTTSTENTPVPATDPVAPDDQTVVSRNQVSGSIVRQTADSSAAETTPSPVNRAREPLEPPAAAPATQPERIAGRLEQTETQSARNDFAEPAPAPRARVATGAAVPSRPNTDPPLARASPPLPKVAVVAPAPRAAPAVQAKTPANSREDIKAALLEGKWTSQGKPASLLPSDTTLCQDAPTKITCWSVPTNVNTKFGEAIYKVEATLQDFSVAGDFRIAYRTLVKLVDAGDSTTVAAESDDAGWQVSEYTTTCGLVSPNQVSCHDEKGIVREYGR